MNGAVSWGVAERVAIRVAGGQGSDGSFRYGSLERDFDELTAKAEELVERETGLRSMTGVARARVTDRAGWVQANLASFQRLLHPVITKLGPKIGTGPFAPASRAVTGAQVGSLLGWMSRRVLGQYDLLLVEDDRPEEQDIVYYVGPNIVELERRFAFPPREFRLWLALHEVTHRVQFTGIPWMRGHFLSLVAEGLDSLDTDPRQLLEAFKRAANEVSAGRNPLSDGIVSLLASPNQAEILGRIQGLMSLLEGHGDVTMDRAAAAEVPNAQRFSRILRERRTTASGPARVLQQAIGIEAKLRQYEQGERFIAAVEAVGGRALVNRAWEGPALLPTLAEVQEPQRWLSRVGVPPAA